MATLSPLRKKISIEMSGDTKYYMVSAKQGDKATRYVIVELLHEGVAYTIPAGARVAANIKKPDGKHIYNTCTYSGSEVTVELTNQALAAAGTAYCDVEVRTNDNTEIITSASFTIEIEETMRKEGAILSSNEFTEIENRIAGHIKDMVDKGNAVADGEAGRQEAERLRKEAEKLRNQQETEREKNSAEAVKNAEAATRAATEATEACEIVTGNANTAIAKANEAAQNADAKAEEAETAAYNANAATTDLVARREAGEFKGEKGDKGDPGENGVITQINGFFTLSGDAEGNLWAHYTDTDTPPNFEVDEEGNIYYVIPDE